MNSIKHAILLTLGLSLALIIIQNTAPVQTRFLWFTAELPAIVLLFLTAAAGFVSGLLAAFMMSSGK